MTNNKIKTKILELESPNKIKERLKIRGFRTIQVSDNAEFESINIFEIRWGYY